MEPTSRTIEYLIIDVQDGHIGGVQHSLSHQALDAQEKMLTVSLDEKAISRPSLHCVAEQLPEPRLQTRVKVQFRLLDADQAPLAVMHLDDDWQQLRQAEAGISRTDRDT